MLCRFFAILVALLTAGCASYVEIKSMAPDRRYDLAGIAAEPFSACMEDILRENYGGLMEFEFRRIFDQRRERWFVSADFKSTLGGATGNYSYSLAFKDVSKGVLVELRSQKTIWGTLQAPEKNIEQYFRECTARKR